MGYVKKNFLNGLDLPSFSALNPAARQWMDTVANVRLHGETHCKPLERFAQEKPLLRPLPALPYDCAVIRSTSANGCCRVVLDTNRYTVPYLYASQKLTLKIYPDQLLALSPRKTHRHSPALVTTAARTSAIPTTSRNCWSIASERASKPSCKPS